MFLYRTFHYLNRDVPLRRAGLIFDKNKSDYYKNGFKDLIIETYDGSGQLVHPDMIKSDGTMWFVATPYPYGMEEYENPSIYNITDADSFIPHTCPISKQSCRTQGTHLSDPAFVNVGPELYCIFRSTEDRKVNHLFRSKYDSVRDEWGHPEVFYSSDDDLLLSPAPVCDGSKIVMYHADWNEGTGHLYRAVFSRDFVFEQSREVSVNGLPEGYSIWHQAVRYISENDRISGLKGLFLVKKKRESNDCRLYYSESHDDGFTWDLKDEVSIPNDIDSVMKYPYKSCFIPDSDGLILSWVDKSGRYRLIRLN